MPRPPLALALYLLAACGGQVAGSGPDARAVAGPDHAGLAAELAVARAGCGRCHPLADDAARRVAPLAGPDLGAAARWHAADGGAGFLRRHHGGEDAEDLAAWLRALAAGEPDLQPAPTTEQAIARGERLFAELACGACHAPDLGEGLAARTDHAHVAAFLGAPAAHRPGVVHDFGLEDAEADALAAFLLRDQLRVEDAPPVPGFAWECFELRIEDAREPRLDGLAPAAYGVAAVIDVSPATRENHFALRFTATLDVPAAGEWTFTTGSDDSSWLWIDEQLVVRNEALAPHRRRSGAVQLDAGPHALRVVFTEAGGGQSLEVLWRGPGVEEAPIPATRADARTTALAPPAPLPAPDAAAVARGRAAAVEKRCLACHAVEDPELAVQATPPLAGPFAALGSGACPADARAASLTAPAQRSLRQPRDATAELRFAMLRDGCTSCHVRDGDGGLPPAVRQGLAEVEDLGEEGRLPPDLTGVGRRLRHGWIAARLADGDHVRRYLRVRMPRLTDALALQYADWLAAADGAPATDDEPPFSPEAVARGRELVGLRGKNCVSCHAFAGLPSTGPQGMDLARQHERLRPAWFREWLLRSAMLRPGTRMPLFWPSASDEDRREVDAIRSWLSLGEAAPVPEGMVPAAGSLVLLPTDRPVLHGAFLDGLSARCIAVGTKDRTHWAFDVAHGRLAWLWRGDFLDATGTWHGRAGKLLRPLGKDRVVLDDFRVGGEATRTVLGHRVTPDGYPVFRVRAGAAEFEDGARARLTADGTVVVRTLHGLRGELTIEWQVPGDAESAVQLLVGGSPAPATSTLREGEELEVVYRW